MKAVTSFGPTPLEQRELLSIPCLIMRGGSSRGAFIRRNHLPEDTRRRDAVLLAAYGSPDSRQIDGIGGSDPLTSKAALVELSERDDADLDYTFCQVGIDRLQVSTGGNCGNMLAGVGPFAIITGLVKPSEPVTTIRIFVTNIRQVVTAEIPVKNGMPVVEGDCFIAGVPDSGAPILLDFGDCAGSVSGRLLPAGAPKRLINLGEQQIEVSLVDASTPFVFVAAHDIGATGIETPEQILADPALMERLENVRGWAAVELGLAATRAEATAISANIPRVMMIASPQSFVTTFGRPIQRDEIDITARQMTMQRPHRALAVTGAICMAVASAIEDSIPWKISGKAQNGLRIGHPGGIFNVRANTRREANGELRVNAAMVERTARQIMSGILHVRTAKVNNIYEQMG